MLPDSFQLSIFENLSPSCPPPPSNPYMLNALGLTQVTLAAYRSSGRCVRVRVQVPRHVIEYIYAMSIMNIRPQRYVYATLNKRSMRMYKGKSSMDKRETRT